MSIFVPNQTNPLYLLCGALLSLCPYSKSNCWQLPMLQVYTLGRAKCQFASLSFGKLVSLLPEPYQTYRMTKVVRLYQILKLLNRLIDKAYFRGRGLSLHLRQSSNPACMISELVSCIHILLKSCNNLTPSFLKSSTPPTSITPMTSQGNLD